MYLKFLLLAVVNLIVPALIRKYAKPINKVVAFLLYAIIVRPLNMLVSSACGIDDGRFLYIPGFFFLFYWIHMLSVGYISKRELRKHQIIRTNKNLLAAQDSLDMAVKLMAIGKKTEAREKFSEISKFFAGTLQAEMANSYISEIDGIP